MALAEEFRENAENCAYLAENASDQPTRQRYIRMQTAWLALADQQDWLNGVVSPLCQCDGNLMHLALY